MADKTYYETLGVSKTASADELKSAYRRLAKQYHPDLYAGKPESEKKQAEEKFKEINHAYSVLSDPQQRASYDQYGNENGPQGFGGGGSGFGGFGGGAGGFDVDDILSSFFGGFGGFGGRNSQSSRANAPQQGKDIGARLTITFEEAAFGVEKTVTIRRVENCPDCKGSGAKGGEFTTCSHCKGTGTVTQTQRTPFGSFQTSTVCPNCKGKGKMPKDPCPTCKGIGIGEKTREIKVNIPAGIDNGNRITYNGEGNAGRNGGMNGSLVVEIKVEPHKLFKRNGADIMVEYPLTVAEASLGVTIQVPTLSGKPEELKIPEGTQDGTMFKIKGKGIKKLRTKNDFGDLYVKVFVEVPKSLTREQKELLQKLEDSFEQKQFPRRKEYNSKI